MMWFSGVHCIVSASLLLTPVLSWSSSSSSSRPNRPAEARDGTSNTVTSSWVFPYSNATLFGISPSGYSGSAPSQFQPTLYTPTAGSAALNSSQTSNSDRLSRLPATSRLGTSEVGPSRPDESPSKTSRILSSSTAFSNELPTAPSSNGFPPVTSSKIPSTTSSVGASMISPPPAFNLSAYNMLPEPSATTTTVDGELLFIFGGAGFSASSTVTPTATISPNGDEAVSSQKAIQTQIFAILSEISAIPSSDPSSSYDTTNLYNLCNGIIVSSLGYVAGLGKGTPNAGGSSSSSSGGCGGHGSKRDLLGTIGSLISQAVGTVECDVADAVGKISSAIGPLVGTLAQAGVGVVSGRLGAIEEAAKIASDALSNISPELSELTQEMKDQQQSQSEENQSKTQASSSTGPSSSSSSSSSSTTRHGAETVVIVNEEIQATTFASGTYYTSTILETFVTTTTSIDPSFSSGVETTTITTTIGGAETIVEGFVLENITSTSYTTWTDTRYTAGVETTLTTVTATSTPTPCGLDSCGGSCSMSPGPLSGAIMASMTEDCAEFSTQTVSALPVSTDGNYGSLVSLIPLPSASSSRRMKGRSPIAHFEESGNSGDDLTASNNTLNARVLQTPTDATADFMKLVSTCNSEQSWCYQGEPTTAQFWPFPQSFRAVSGVGGLYGCTSVVVVSSKGVYLSHITENPVFVDQDWNLSSDDYFKTMGLDAILNGAQLAEGLISLQGTAARPGPLNALYNPVVIVVTPYSNEWDAHKFGITTPLRYEQRADLLASAVSSALGVAKGQIIGYTRGTADAARSGTTIDGKIILESDPYQEVLQSESENKKEVMGKWRLWVVGSIAFEQLYFVRSVSQRRDLERRSNACAAGANLTSASVSSPTQSVISKTSISVQGSSPVATSSNSTAGWWQGTCVNGEGDLDESTWGQCQFSAPVTYGPTVTSMLQVGQCPSSAACPSAGGACIATSGAVLCGVGSLTSTPSSTLTTAKSTTIPSSSSTLIISTLPKSTAIPSPSPPSAPTPEASPNPGQSCGSPSDSQAELNYLWACNANKTIVLYCNSEQSPYFWENYSDCGGPTCETDAETCPDGYGACCPGSPAG